MQTKVVFWLILRSDGIRCGLMRRRRPRTREGVYVFVDGREQTRDGFWRILQGEGIWCGKNLGRRDGGRLALRKGQ
jgi:hypothetical protein